MGKSLFKNKWLIGGLIIALLVGSYFLFSPVKKGVDYVGDQIGKGAEWLNNNVLDPLNPFNKGDKEKEKEKAKAEGSKLNLASFSGNKASIVNFKEFNPWKGEVLDIVVVNGETELENVDLKIFKGLDEEVITLASIDQTVKNSSMPYKWDGKDSKGNLPSEKEGEKPGILYYIALVQKDGTAAAISEVRAVKEPKQEPTRKEVTALYINNELLPATEKTIYELALSPLKPASEIVIPLFPVKGWEAPLVGKDNSYSRPAITITGNNKEMLSYEFVNSKGAKLDLSKPEEAIRLDTDGEPFYIKVKIDYAEFYKKKTELLPIHVNNTVTANYGASQGNTESNFGLLLTLNDNGIVVVKKDSVIGAAAAKFAETKAWKLVTVEGLQAEEPVVGGDTDYLTNSKKFEIKTGAVTEAEKEKEMKEKRKVVASLANQVKGKIVEAAKNAEETNKLYPLSYIVIVNSNGNEDEIPEKDEVGAIYPAILQSIYNEARKGDRTKAGTTAMNPFEGAKGSLAYFYGNLDDDVAMEAPVAFIDMFATNEEFSDYMSALAIAEAKNARQQNMGTVFYDDTVRGSLMYSAKFNYTGLATEYVEIGDLGLERGKVAVYKTGDSQSAFEAAKLALGNYGVVEFAGNKCKDNAKQLVDPEKAKDLKIENLPILYFEAGCPADVSKTLVAKVNAAASIACAFEECKAEAKYVPLIGGDDKTLGDSYLNYSNGLLAKLVIGLARAEPDGIQSHKDMFMDMKALYGDPTIKLPILEGNLKYGASLEIDKTSLAFGFPQLNSPFTVEEYKNDFTGSLDKLPGYASPDGMVYAEPGIGLMVVNGKPYLFNNNMLWQSANLSYTSSKLTFFTSEIAGRASLIVRPFGNGEYVDKISIGTKALQDAEKPELTYFGFLPFGDIWSVHLYISKDDFVKLLKLGADKANWIVMVDFARPEMPKEETPEDQPEPQPEPVPPQITTAACDAESGTYSNETECLKACKSPKWCYDAKESDPNNCLVCTDLSAIPAAD